MLNEHSKHSVRRWVDYDFNDTIEVCKMIDVDGINSTTADDTTYTEGWTIYLYKDGNLFDWETTEADGYYTWRYERQNHESPQFYRDWHI